MSTNAIEIRGVTKAYPGFQLGPLDLTVPRGAIYGLIGPNGAGKTTLIDLIFGMGRNEAGQIRVLGFDHRRDEVALKQRTAYVGPDLNFQIWKKVGWAIRFVRGFFPEWDNDYCSQLMREFRLGDSDKISELSFGARTKLSLLLALARRPQVLVLDEPMTGLDTVSKQQIYSELLKLVKDGDRTVLISSHGLSDLERFTDHIGMLKDGKMLLEGGTDEVVGRYRIAEFFTDNGAKIENRKGLTLIHSEQNRWRVLVDQNSDAVEWLRAQGARDISLTPMALEDLFVALVKNEVVA